jgi:hypothetical protein
VRISVRGAALIDLIFTGGVIVVLAGIAIPAFQASQDHRAPRAAGQFLATRLQMLRLESIKRNVVVALRFDPDDPGRVRAYVDGDGDGVGQGDVDRGTDYPIDPGTRIADFFDTVTFGIRADVPDPDGSGTIAADSDPVRLGSSNFLSFSPLGSASSGTIYLTGRGGPQVCVRVLGATGRVRVLWFDRVSRVWRQD